MTDFNLHLTGDLHAVTAANNLLAAAIETRMLHEKQQSGNALFQRLFPKLPKSKVKKDSPHDFEICKSLILRCKKLGIDIQSKKKLKQFTKEERERIAKLNIDPETINWKRVLDTSDRHLREIDIGLGKEENQKRRTGFDISVASECMAILALATDLKDFRKRIGEIVFAESKETKTQKSEPLTTEDLGVAGAMTVLMKDAVNPTLIQTVEGTPVFVHAGPFANIAHGNSSIIADKLALRIVGKDGYVLTEAGFGADIGMEKFFDIKCRASGLYPDCVVIVVSIRAIKHHGGKKDDDFTKMESVEEEMGFLKKGIDNLKKHIDNTKVFGVPAIVCINKFNLDTKEEIQFIIDESKKSGAFDCCLSNHWAEGGKGAIDISKSVINACKWAREKKLEKKFLYQLVKENENENLIKKNIEKIVKDFYGGDGVVYSEKAQKQIDRFVKMGFDKLPICFAKTQYSLSHDEKLIGVPKGFKIPVNEVRVYTGAGIVVPVVGSMKTIPGLPTRPLYYDIDIDDDGEIYGLS